VTVLILDKVFVCANVGDSRAILYSALEPTGEWEIDQCSRDHKPDLGGELERIVANGGRVEAFKDIGGNPMGPMRVWQRDDDVPGLAMSRSFGDGMAESLGVIANPGIIIVSSDLARDNCV